MNKMNRLAVGWSSRAQQEKKVEICYGSSNGIMSLRKIHIDTQTNATCMSSDGVLRIEYCFAI